MSWSLLSDEIKCLVTHKDGCSYPEFDPATVLDILSETDCADV